MALSNKNGRLSDEKMKLTKQQTAGCLRRFVTTSAIYGIVIIQSFQQKFRSLRKLVKKDSFLVWSCKSAEVGRLYAEVANSPR